MTLQRLRGDHGFALLPAMMILVVLLGLGVALLNGVDVQSHQTRIERAGEGAFNLAESVLDDEAEQAMHVWPGGSATAYPVCTQSSAPQANPLPGCPGTALNTNFSATNAGSDFKSTPSWKVQLVDDTGTGGSLYYSDAILPTAPAWDSNGDGKIWVRAEATVGAQKRIVVSQIIEQTQSVMLPPNGLIAGAFSTTNNGRKVIVYAQNPNKAGSLVGKLLVRCGSSSTTPSPGNSCLSFDASKGQLSPAGSYQAGYVDPNGSSTLTPQVLAGLKAYAIQQGTYYAAGTCPASLTGAVVYIENANCSYNTNAIYNSSTQGGAVVIAAGTLTLAGGLVYYGAIYAANAQGSSPPCTASNENTVVSETGTSLIQGGVFIDKCGILSSGSSAVNLIFDNSLLGSLKALVAPSLSKNTFRVLSNSGS